MFFDVIAIDLTTSFNWGLALDVFGIKGSCKNGLCYS